MYSGRELELDLLGAPKFGPAFKAELAKISNEHGYAPRDPAMDLIRRYPSDDPTNPSKDFARELRLAVMEELGLEDGDELGFYNAVGTPVDRFHGVDAWMDLSYMRIGDPSRVFHAVATLDATLRPDKLADGHKADVMIPDMPDATDPRYLDRIEAIAKEIVGTIGPRLPNKWHAAPILPAAQNPKYFRRSA